jgi:hypothetical protein
MGDLALGNWAPRREHHKTDDGWVVTVTPPPFIKHKGKPLPARTVKLTISQFALYQRWLRGDLGALMTSMRPAGLSVDDIEILLSGIDPKTWDEMFA